MDWDGLYHFLFETYAGVGILVAIVFVVTIICSVIMEYRTRKTFVDRGPRNEDDDDDWSFFDDDDEEEDEEDEKKDK